MPRPEVLLLIASILLLLSVLATKLGVPGLLLFLAIGMLAGSDGPGGIWFDNYSLAQFIGTLALIFILYSGGFSPAGVRCVRYWGLVCRWLPLGCYGPCS